MQFDVLSGYNPLPEKPVKDVAAKDKKDKKDKGDATEGDAAAVKKKRTTPKSALPGASAVKAPAQKGAPR